MNGIDGQVTISWDPTSGADSYNLYWAWVPGVTKATGAKLGGVSSPYVHSGLMNNTTHYYVVTAENSAGEGPESAEVSARLRQFFTDMLHQSPASDAQAGDWLGTSASISGDYATLGAPHEDGGAGDLLADAGAVYVFHRTGDTTWDAGTKLAAADAGAGDWFGYSVSVSGNYLVVGARYEDGGTGNPLANAGAAYVFYRTGDNTWDAGTKLIAPDAQAGDEFGISVSMSGDYAIVGARYEDGGVGDPRVSAGAAYVFRRTGVNTWDAGTKLMAADALADDFFGTAVAISGDYALVGADGSGSTSDKGAAYVFHRTGENTWDAGTKLVASDGSSLDWFGSCVAISGDYALVGANGDDGPASPALNDAGAAYMFHRTGVNAWDAGTKLVAPDVQRFDMFGISVAISGDHAVVGAFTEDGGAGDPLADAGAAYMFHRTGVNTWDAGTKLVAPDAQAYDYFGRSVAISGEYALVGAYGEDGGALDPMSQAGAGYFY